MGKTLVIVESPSKAKTISKFLGKNYHVEATAGHVKDLPKSQLGVDIENDFTPRYITIRGKGSIIEKIKKEAKKADSILLATDPDREGEAISWHISNILNMDDNKDCRIEFHEITKDAIKNAIKAPRRINQNLVNAQQARRILDRLVGYKISPLLWDKVKYGLSAGRVQSVAVRIICDREEEINNFKPEEYWTLAAILIDNNGRMVQANFYGDEKGRIELKNKDMVDDILNQIEGKDLYTVSVKKGQKKKNPPLAFTTSTLQQEAYKRLGFTAKKTMALAQQLYEGVEVAGEGAVGLLTYIRTDSTRIADEAKNEAKKYILEIYGDNYLGDTKIVKSKTKIQDAHEGIRPTSIYRTPEKIATSLSKDQYKLYKLIWERFLASQMSPAVYNTVTVDLKCEGYIFKASGSMLIFPGYLVAYSDEEDENSEYPEFSEGSILKVISYDPKQHFTQPPPRYTEASLIKALEDNGIGRPSTYAPIISTIQERGYVKKEKKYLVPTELGFIVTDIMKNYFKDIVDIEFTAELESKLDQIEEGNIEWVEIVREFYEEFNKALEYAKEKMGNVTLEEEVSDVICERCGRNMVIKHGRYGKFLACPGYPECKNTKPYFEKIGIKCPVCGGEIVKKQSKKGRPYYGCINNPECGFMTWDKPIDKICPICGSILVEKKRGGKNYFKCSDKSCKYSEV
ncbi:type I DNA topoisomerase [Calorimonas adulescens]|uniref:DNA topoisomerase 1 n=1 Tax=Calorimonas adulescens TaxID=2606906 RepID=A0A5D8QGS3_9THEO|nr:type I DNA topoisomerase [Calorimonas adulescens]TZE83364.1 type I DNA topoisomerase [Calorimonas adulescens]